MKKTCKYLFVLCAMMVLMCFQSPLCAEAAELKGNADWKWPVPASNTLSSCYIDGREHYAIDIVAAKGTEIYASYEGEVIDVYTSCSHNYGKTGGCGCNRNLGNSVSIRHTYNGVDYVSRYGHLTSVYVSEGDIVTMDTVIGTMGSTGYSQNHHLDFRIYQGTTKKHEKSRDCVDPLMDLFLDIPEGLNANRASTGCCYSYVGRVLPAYEELRAEKAEKARLAEEARLEAEQAAFEQAARSWIAEEIGQSESYLERNLFEVSLGFENFVSHYK